MNRTAIWLSIMVMVLIFPVAPYLVAPDAYAIGHYDIPGTFEGGCDVCHDFVNGEYAPASGNLRWVRDSIEWPTSTIHSPVKFTTFEDLSATPDGTLADGNDALLDGPCEVCHDAYDPGPPETGTKYHNNAGDGTTHLDGEDCSACHPHFADDMDNFFEPRFIGTQSHQTHWEDPKGPLMGEGTCDFAEGGCHFGGDFSLFGLSPGQSLAATTVCDGCHSEDGLFDGVAEAKAKWEDAVYEENGFELKAGNENWCTTCHDGGTSTVDGVDAPNVMGDNTLYGYNVSGHGNHGVNCDGCHDLAVSHTDGNPRTYEVNELTSPATVINDYRTGYRLNEDMAVPRYGQSDPEAFKFCMQPGCHVFADITGVKSNFRNDLTGQQLHGLHLNAFPVLEASDTDFDAVGCSLGECIDSAMTCINCHQVHGPPMDLDPGAGLDLQPNPAMIRFGELISTPGTYDKVPALDMRWYKADGVTPTADPCESQWGGARCGTLNDVSVNHVCAGCHPSGEIKWKRTPRGSVGITVDNAWTTDLSDGVKNIFAVGEDIRYHVTFTVKGPCSYHTVLGQSGAGNDASMNGNDWVTLLNQQGTLPAGTYNLQFDKTIPGTASPGSPAKLVITMGIYESPGGVLLDWDKKTHFFSIAP